MQQIMLSQAQIELLTKLLNKRSASDEERHLCDYLKGFLKYEQLALVNLDEIPF
jgi:hypothetical protein